MPELFIGIAIAAALCLLLYLYWKARRAEATYPPIGAFVEVEGVRLHYVRKGSGRPVVLLHGSDGFLQDFAFAALDRLAQEYDTLAFDRPGHGYSGAPANEVPDPCVQARLIHAALTRLGIEKPVLVGHSWSGALLMAYALAYPDTVSGLVLLGAWLYPSETPPSLLLRIPQIPVLGTPLAALLLAPVKSRIIRRNLARAFAPDAVPEAYARQAESLWQRWPWQTRIFAQENTADRPALKAFRSHYAAISLPVVLVIGEDDTTVDPAQHSYRLHAALPDSALIVLPQTGHELPQTRPEAVCDAVRLCWMRAAQYEASPRVQEPGGAPAAQDTAAQRARELVFRYGWNATAYQILNPEMEFWFPAEGDAVVGFVTRSQVRVVAGAPICAAERVAAVIAEFEQAATRAGERVCYFGAAARLQSALLSQPTHSAIVIGAQPIWHPQRWPDILARNASLRAQLNRARNKGVRVSEWPTERANDHADLQRCLEEWLAARPLPPLRFLTEPMTLDRLADRRIFVAEREGASHGFLIATPIPDRNGWLIEQVVRGNSAPNGTVECLVDAAMHALAEGGSHYVTLGLAPLSRRTPIRTKPAMLWLRLLLTWVRAHGRRFYNFDGLDAFKAKFKPDSWEPLYAITNEPRFSAQTLYAIASAFTDEPPIGMIGRAFTAAFRQEIAWLAERAHRRHA